MAKKEEVLKVTDEQFKKTARNCWGNEWCNY